MSLKFNRITNSVSDKAKCVDSLPDVPNITNNNKTLANIKKIASTAEKYGLTTVETQATLLALSFAYCQCVPKIASFEYTSVKALKNKFPTTFINISEKGLEQWLFCQSQHKKTEEQFYNCVYDSTADGYSLGNLYSDDGYKFAETGLLPIVGRNAFETMSYNLNKSTVITSKQLIDDIDLAIQIACIQLITLGKYVPAGNKSLYFYEMLRRFPQIDQTVAKQAYEHFYGAKLFESYGTTNLTAGNDVSPNDYYGSGVQRVDDYLGFKDPDGKYPYNRDTKQSTIDKLARGVAANTIVTQKETTRRVGIPIANNAGSWDQPHSGYAAEYPYNNVVVSESGHVHEIDDTPGHERLHTYHRSGTFEEIIENGTKTTRIVGDGYQIIDRNGHIEVSGNANVTVGGNINIFCMSNASIEVNGSTNMTCHGNLTIGAGKDVNIAAGGNMNLWADKGMNLQCGENQVIRSRKDLYLTSDQQICWYSEGDSFITSQRRINQKAKQDVAIQSEEFLSLTSKDHTFLSSDGPVDVYSGINTSVGSGGGMYFSALTINSQASLYYDIISLFKYRVNGGSIDLNSKSWFRTHSLLDTSVDSSTIISMNSLLDTTISAHGKVQVDALMDIGLSSKGIISADSTLIALNTGLTSPLNPPSIPTNNASMSTRASAGFDASYCHPGVPWEQMTPYPAVALCPAISTKSTNSPMFTDDSMIEDVETLQSKDGQLISNTIVSDDGFVNPIQGPTAEDISSPELPYMINQYGQQIRGTGNYNSNTRVSEHFILSDFFDGGFNKRHVLHDQCGLTEQEIVSNLSDLAENVIENIVDILPGGIQGYKKQWRINSGYRSINGNASIRSASKTSQHCKGQAVDIQLVGGSKRKHYALIQEIAKLISYDQLILEYNIRNTGCWIHISYDKNRLRTQKLTINLCNSKTHPGFVLYA